MYDTMPLNDFVISYFFSILKKLKKENVRNQKWTLDFKILFVHEDMNSCCEQITIGIYGTYINPFLSLLLCPLQARTQIYQ